MGVIRWRRLLVSSMCAGMVFYVVANFKLLMYTRTKRRSGGDNLAYASDVSDLNNISFAHNLTHLESVEKTNRVTVQHTNVTLQLEDTKYLTRYVQHAASFCNNSFIGYSGYFVKLSNVVIYPSYGTGKIGGETIKSVLNQGLEKEFYILKPGFFKLNCKTKFEYVFEPKSHLTKWKAALEPSDMIQHSREVQHTTIAIIRYDYANMYWAMADIYDIYLLKVMLCTVDDAINVLWVDGHPQSQIDVFWTQIFGNVTRIGHISQPTQFQTLIWGLSVYNSPLLGPAKPPLLEEFRKFVLLKTGILNEKKLECSNISILVIWRRDYAAHPRNPSGKVQRKISNEHELLGTISNLFPGHNVKGVQLDLLSVEEQVRMASSTDVLIGMHGAGLSHTLFLPKHAALIELFPADHSMVSHFQYIANWRKLVYTNWKGKGMGKDHSLVEVDAVFISGEAMKTYLKLCPST